MLRRDTHLETMTRTFWREYRQLQIHTTDLYYDWDDVPAETRAAYCQAMEEACWSVGIEFE